MTRRVDVQRSIEEIDEALSVESFFEQAPCQIFLKDLDGRYPMANQCFRDSLGLPAERIPGLRDEDLFPASVAREYRDNDRQVVSYGRAILVEEHSRTPEGETIGLVDKFPVRDASGAVIALGGIASDISERKQAELALQESEHRFRLFMDNGPTVAWIKDEQGRHVYVNKEFTKRLGLAQEEVLGKTNEDFFALETAAKLRKNNSAVLASGVPAEFVEETLDEDGTTRTWLSTPIHKYTHVKSRLSGQGCVANPCQVPSWLRLCALTWPETHRFHFVCVFVNWGTKATAG